MKVAVVKESFPGERRVALVPAAISPLAKAGLDVAVESGAGAAAGFADDDYRAAGATIVTRDEAFAADCVLAVRACGAEGDGWSADRDRLRPGVVVVGMCDPLSSPAGCREAAERGASVFALELVPRITRAQSMDVLSSQANIAGYRAVLLAANVLPRILPMMTTAAGTLPGVDLAKRGKADMGLHPRGRNGPRPDQFSQSCRGGKRR
jgi:NAD(P) transhydrogenase subunit alpha